MTDFFSPVLAAGWIAKLVSRLGQVKGERSKQIEQLSDAFGDARILARNYINPDCQLLNPADFNEDDPRRSLQTPISHWIDEFLAGEFEIKDGRNTVFILSDAGMGKTSLLMMLQLTAILGFWPKSIRFRILALGTDTLKKLEEHQGKSKTILLLDALDEDPTRERIETRVTNLLDASKHFRRVFITCRTQFFPKTDSELKEEPGKMSIGGFSNCNLLYLSPFSNNQINEYLSKKYPTGPTSRIKRWFSHSEEPKERARKLVGQMKSLRMRPMLLAYIDDLMNMDLREQASEYDIYEALVRHWLEREQRRRKNRGATTSELWDACVRLALHMQGQEAEGRQIRSIGEQELDKLLEDHPANLSGLEFGGQSLLNKTSRDEFRFAHYTIQEFLVAQSLLGRKPFPLDEPIMVTQQIASLIEGEIRPFRSLEKVRWKMMRGVPEESLLHEREILAPGAAYSIADIRKALGRGLSYEARPLPLYYYYYSTSLRSQRSLSGAILSSLIAAENNLALLYESLGDLKGARRRFRLAVGLGWLIEPPSEVIQNLHRRFGGLLARQTHFDAAIVHHEIALQHIRMLSTEKGEEKELTQLRTLGDLEFQTGDYSAAEGRFVSALSLAGRLNAPDDAAYCCSRLGDIFAELGELDSAVRWFRSSVGTRQEIADQDGAAGALVKLGRTFTRQGKYSLAAESFERALSASQLAENAGGVKVALNGLANALQAMGNLDEAEIKYRLAREITDLGG
ncbi:MAG: tetratricopeptide repeat protein [Acidobacteriota bacterium]